MELTKREKRKLRLERLRQQSREAHEEHEQRAERLNQIQEPSKTKKYYIIGGLICAVILAIASYSVYSMNKPGSYDSFAKCLSDKGAVMYGAMDWCKFTQGQKAMFGKSFKYVNYHEYTDLPGIKTTPTWVINGQWHVNVQPFDKLAALTGCKI